MKRFIAIISILSYLIAALQFTVPYLSYFANYTYFATEACINKYNPELHCNGKCQLKKMVRKKHNHHDSAPDGTIQLVKSSSTIFFFERTQNKVVKLSSTLQKYFDVSLTTSQHITLPATPPPQLG